MNGPVKMYTKKPIIRHDIPVELPSCMYKLKSLYGARNGVAESAGHVSSVNKKLDIFDQVKQFLKNNQTIEGMAELAARQEKILQQLADLKKQMLNISSELKIKPTSTTNESIRTATVQLSNVEDLPNIVIHAGPNYPPFSLALVQKLWQDQIHLSITTHLHSTVSSLPEKTKELSDTLQNFKPKKSNLPKLSVRLIWNNVGADLELLVSVVPILGEVNVLRYLARCSRNILNYESLEDRHEIDSLLDLSYLLPRAKTKTERSNHLQSLNKSLGKAQWLVGRNQVSVADLAAYSAVRQVSLNELNANLVKWYNRLETAF